MSALAAKRLAWGSAALSVALALSGLLLALATYSTGVGVQDVFLLVIVVGFSTVGVLIASSPVRNRIGWIYCGVALSAGVAGLAGAYARFWMSGGSASRTLGEIAAVYSVSGWMGWVLVPATFLLLLFPDGKLLSPRWRLAAWLCGVGIAAEFVVGLLRPGPLEDFPAMVNPIGVELAGRAEPVTSVLVTMAILSSATSLVLRFRRVSGLERQQIKWLAYAGAIAPPVLLIAIFSYDVLGPTLANAVIQLTVLGVPLAAAIAILHYRLYDIDLVVNRTLVYGVARQTLEPAHVSLMLLKADVRR